MENKEKRVSPKRKTSSPPEKSPKKRQRNPVKRFDIDEEVQKSARKRRLSGEVLFERGSYLAVRADRGRFYICQASVNVYSRYKSFKIRWLEIEEPPHIYKKAYEDTVELDCVIAKVVMVNYRRGMMRLDENEANRVKKLLQAAEAGTDVTRLDVNLFSPSSKRALSPKLKEPPMKRAKIEPKPAPKNARGRKKVVSTRGRVTNRGKRAAKNNSAKPTTSQNGKPGLTRAATLPVGRVAALASASKSRLTKSLSVSLKKSSSISSQVSVAKSVLAKAVTLGRSSKNPKKKEALKKAIKKVAKEGKKLIKDRNPKPNQRLVPNPDIEVPDKDPFYETKVDVPFVSTKAHSRLVNRAVKLKDHRKLNDLINNSEQISSLDEELSISRSDNPVTLAVKLQDMTALKILQEQDQYDKKKPRAPGTDSLMEPEGTGRYNPLTLGIKKIRKLHLSRGGREGNNALVKDLEDRHDEESLIEFAIRNNISFDKLKILLTTQGDTNEAFPLVHLAVREGNRKLAAAIMKYAETFGGYGFNNFHKEALEFDGKENWKDIRSTSVTKKPHENKNITPIHCAAINPHEKYLEKLLTVEPEYNLEDQDKWRPIHYAAVCEGPGPLKLLIKKGISVSEGTKGFLTPLCLAALKGRLENVKVLIQHLIEQYKNADPKMLKKFGPGYINRPIKSSWTPLHFAAYNGHLDVVSYLIESGADPNKKLNATCEGLTCLMIACQMGYIDMVKYLVYHGSRMEMKDKFGRTALIHAIRDGNSQVAAYLLSRGANPNLPDSSVNSPLHYAAAFGWYFCMKLLLDAGAVPDAPNMWKLTPLAASYLKGHIGLTYMLLDIPGININFQDDEGRTLIMNAVKGRLNTKIYEQVKFLVEEKGADVTLRDKRNKTILDYIVGGTIPYSGHDFETLEQNDANKDHKRMRDEAVKVLNDLADLVIKAGCDPSLVDESKNTPALVLLYRGDVHLVLPLLEKLLSQSDALLIEGSDRNLLAYLCRDVYDKKILNLLNMLKKVKLKSGITGEEELKKMAHIKDNFRHQTPLIVACHSYNDNRRNLCSTVNQDLYREAQEQYKQAREVLKFVASFNDEIEYSYEYEETCNGSTVKKTGTMSAIFPLLEVDDSIRPNEITNNEVNLRPAFKMLTKGKSFNIDLPHSRYDEPILFHYVTKNDLEMVKFLLNHGANVNFTTKHERRDGMTPLLTAVQNGTVDMVKLLLEHGADVKVVTKYDENTVLHVAVVKNDLSMTRLLLERGADINAVNAHGRTVLHQVAEDANDDDEAPKDLELLLLKSGANTLAKDNNGRIPLHYVFNSSCAFDPVESYSNFATAMANQDVDVADKTGETPLHFAALQGSTVCCMLLLQRGCNINAKSEHGNTPLSYAVKNGHQSAVLMLMEKGADVSGHVITHPHADVPPKKDEDELEEKGGDEDVGYDDWYDDFTEEDLTAKRCKQRERLLKNLQKLKRKPVWKWEPRHFPAPWKPGEKGYPIFQGLIERGWQGLTYIAMDLLKPFGMSFAAAIEIAIKTKKYRFAKTLMDKQIDKSVLTEKNPQKQSLLHALIKLSTESNLAFERKIFEDLIAAGVCVSDQDEDGFTPLHYAAKNLSHTLSLCLLELKDNKVMSARDKYGRSPVAALLWNATNSSTYLTRLKDFIEADKSAVDCLYDFCPVDTFLRAPKPHLQPSEYYVQYDPKVSPLIHAICNSKYNVVNVLLENGASVNLATKDGVTPLMYAVRMNDLLMVELLLNTDQKNFVNRRTQKGNSRREEIIKKKRKRPQFTEEDPFANIDPLASARTDQLYGAVDNHGWSVLHHMVNSTPLGAYQNLVMLRHLIDAGVPLDLKDKQGLTPLQHALNRGATHLACAIQCKLGVSRAEWKKPTHTQPTVSDEITWDWVKADFTADAKDKMKEVEEKQMEVEQEFIPKPDHRASRAGKILEIVRNDEDGTFYDILMNKVDVKIGEFGLFNFYKMQVLHVKEDDIFMLFTCWGRIGDNGQYQKTPFATKEAAVAEFCKIFKSKSGNEWSNRKEFQNQPKLYRLVDVLYRKREQVPEVYFDLKSDLPSKLSPYLKDLVLEMSSISMMKYMLKNTGVDIPFGALKLETLEKAMELLNEMSEPARKKVDLQHRLQTENIEEYHQLCEKLWRLSTEYYYLIPKSGYQFEKLRPLEDLRTINSAKNTIRDLLELEFSNRLLLAAQHRVKEINPLDYIYRAVDTQTSLMSQTDPVVKLIMQYVYATSAVDVEAIYAISRSGEDDRLAACKVGNRHLLWHGTRTSNLISILSRGLLIAPPEAATTGMRFGKGIYTANSFQFSQNYCHNDGGNRTRYMLLCEVALGKVCGIENACECTVAPEGFDSVRANAKSIPDRNFNVMIPSGAIMPLGSQVASDEPYGTVEANENRLTDLLYRRESVNQFIVYKAEQVALRYIVQYR